MFWHPPNPRFRHAPLRATLSRRVLATVVYSGVLHKSWLGSFAPSAPSQRPPHLWRVPLTRTLVMRNLQTAEKHNHPQTEILLSGSASCEDPPVTKIPRETRTTVWKHGCESFGVLLMGFFITNILKPLVVLLMGFFTTKIFGLQVRQLFEIWGAPGLSSNESPEGTRTFHRKTLDNGKINSRRIW